MSSQSPKIYDNLQTLKTVKNDTSYPKVALNDNSNTNSYVNIRMNSSNSITPIEEMENLKKQIAAQD